MEIHHFQIITDGQCDGSELVQKGLLKQGPCTFREDWYVSTFRDICANPVIGVVQFLGEGALRSLDLSLIAKESKQCL